MLYYSENKLPNNRVICRTLQIYKFQIHKRQTYRKGMNNNVKHWPKSQVLLLEMNDFSLNYHIN